MQSSGLTPVVINKISLVWKKQEICIFGLYKLISYPNKIIGLFNDNFTILTATSQKGTGLHQPLSLLPTNTSTVTDLANFCAAPLFKRTQGSQACLEKRNHLLSSNLVVWCAKIEPKTKKLQKTVEKPSFLTIFFVKTEVF